MKSCVRDYNPTRERQYWINGEKVASLMATSLMEPRKLKLDHDILYFLQSFNEWHPGS